jgi:hypothetical protein
MTIHFKDSILDKFGDKIETINKFWEFFARIWSQISTSEKVESLKMRFCL